MAEAARNAWRAAAVLAAGVLVYLLWLPPVSQLKTKNPRTTAYIQRYVERTRRKGRRPVVMMRWVPLHEISEDLRHAVIVSEDDMFYRHGGVDWEALREAASYNWRKGRLARGASTITQQVARNLFLYPARNPLRKAKEMLIAWKLERALSKDRILEIYLNIAEWGVGIYGAEAASNIYFGKHAGELGLEESVALAAALPSPWRLNPAKPVTPKLAKRREVLVRRMRGLGYVEPDVPDAEIEVPEDIEEALKAPDGIRR